jgi:hypothetical protein
MPPPGQPPVDLRDANSSLRPNARTAPLAGRIETVAAKQETLESNPPAAIGSTSDESASDSAAPSGLPVATGPLTAPTPAAVSNSSPIINMQRNRPAHSGNPGQRTQSANDDQATISTPGASIEVSTSGPRTISVGKNASYGVDVINNGRAAAQQLAVTFTVPSWIELTNTSLTTGSKELLRETDATRVVWRIDRLEPGKTQRLTLDVIPRKAQVFDLNVEWSVAPLVGAVQVQVTEPLLKIGITGPDEVQFGQTALYNLAIRNPGTGTAENVNIMLSEALGGERAALGNIGPGEEKNIQVELIARSAGALDLSANVTGDGNLQDSAAKKILVRRAQLAVAIAGPTMKYAGSTGNFQITVENVGDAIAQDIYAAIGLPAGVQYVSGIEAAERIEGGMRWSVGALPPGGKRTYTVACQMNATGQVLIETGVRGAGDLADAATFQTMVETVADLVLTVDDPQGPLPLGQDVQYKIAVKNRGTRAARAIEVVMQFSNGIEPVAAEGRGNKINPGEVVFEPIEQLDPSDEVVLIVTARASAAGTHMFRAQLSCVEADAREVAQGTTKFFGDEGNSAGETSETSAPESPTNVGQLPAQNIMR